MGVQDVMNYIVFTNPISSSVQYAAQGTLKAILPYQKIEVPVTTTIIEERIPLWKLAREGGPYTKIAGLMGATAVIMGAYGAHKTYPEDKNVKTRKHVFDTGNRYHFYSTMALLAVPLCRYPKMSGSFLIAGTLLFSGACYYHSITGENKFGRLAPFGGTCLILGWLAMVL